MMVAWVRGMKLDMLASWDDSSESGCAQPTYERHG